MEDGDVLGAIVIPEDTTEKLQSGLEPAEIEVFYNAEDPVKADFVRDTIKSQVQDANTALTRRLSEVAIEFLDLLATGGEYSFLGRDFDVLGLERSEQILREARADLPPGSQAREQIDQVIGFAKLARENLDLSDDVLSSVSSPLRVKQTAARRRRHAAQLVRGGTGGGGLAHVHHAAAGRRHAGAGARGQRVRPAGPGAGVEDRAAGGEGRPGGGLLAGGLPADAGRAGPVRGPGVGPLPPLGRGRGRGRAGVRGAGAGGGRAHARRCARRRCCA